MEQGTHKFSSRTWTDEGDKFRFHIPLCFHSLHVNENGNDLISLSRHKVCVHLNIILIHLLLDVGLGVVDAHSLWWVDREVLEC